jgi:hypothetical protein
VAELVEAVERASAGWWTAVPGGAVRIGVDPSGNPWIVNSGQRIYSS